MDELPVGPPVAPRDVARPGRGERRGRFVSLRPVDAAADAEVLFAGSHGDPARERLWTYMAYGPFRDVRTFEDWLSSLMPQQDPLFLTVVDNASGKPVGVVSYLAIRPELRVLELGHIWYVTAAQRGPANTEAAFLMLQESFDLGYRRVEWKCDALNAASRRAALRLGFTYEGIFRQHMVTKGRNRDSAWFAMLDGEWPARRARFERWRDEGVALSAQPVD